MEILEDGKAAIGVEAEAGLIRILDGVPSDEDPRPPYKTVGSWLRFSDDVVKIYGFAGPGMTLRHIRLMVRWGLSNGFRVAYIDRLPGHVMPGAEQIADGDFKGWWRLDLVETRLLGRKAVPSDS